MIRIIGKQTSGRPRQRLGISFFHQHAGLWRGNHFRRAPDIRGNDRGAAGHGLQQHIGPTFPARCQYQRIHRTIIIFQLLLTDDAQKTDPVRKPE